MTFDPRQDEELETPRTRRLKRMEEQSEEVSFPIAWIIIGGLAGLLTIGLIALGVVNILSKRTVTVTPEVTTTVTMPAAVLTPTVSILATEIPTATPVAPAVTPTPDQTVPTTLKEGGYAKVVNTEGAGVSLRAGPGTNNARLAMAEEGSVLSILNGPKDDENQQGYVWWYVKMADGTEGWAVQDFLQPTTAP